MYSTYSAFNNFTLLVGRQEEHPMRCRCDYMSGARCRLFANCPADGSAIPKPHHLLPHLFPQLNSDGF